MPRAFIPNPAFPKQIEAEDEYREGVAKVAEDVKGQAEPMLRSIGAPWMPRKNHDLLEVQDDGQNVYLVNTDHGGHLQEYGSKNNPPHAPLRRAAMAAGLEVDERPDS